MAGEVIDEAYVEIHARIDASFSRDVQRAVDRAVKPVQKDIERSLAPISATVQDAIAEPFKEAADDVRDAMDDVSASIRTGTRKTQKDLDKFDDQIDKIHQSLKALRSDAAERILLDVDADTSDVDAKVRDLERALRRLQAARADVKIDVDAAAAEAELDTVARDRTVNIDVDTGIFKKALSGVTDSIGSALSGVGGIGGTIGKSLASASSRFLPLLLAIAAAAALVAPAIVSIAAAAITASGSLLTLGASLSSLGLAFATVKIGLMGMGDAIKAASKAEEELAKDGKVSEATQKALAAAMDNLAPAAQRVVGVIGKLKNQFEDVRKVVQQKLFEGLAGPLQQLGNTYLPVIQKVLGGVAKDLNGVGKNFVDFATKGSTVTAVTEALQSMRRSLQDLIPAIGNVFAGIGNLFGAALPKGEELSKTIRNVSEDFRAWTERITNDGSFQRFLDKAGEAMGSILGLIKDVGSALGQVIGQGTDSGIKNIEALGKAFADLAGFLASADGRDALSDFFTTGEEAMQSFIDLAGSLEDIFTGVGDALGPLLDIFNVLSKLGGIMPDLRDVFAIFKGDFDLGIVDGIKDFGGAIKGLFTDDAEKGTKGLGELVFDPIKEMAAGLDAEAAKIKEATGSVKAALEFGLGDNTRFEEALKRVPALIDANLVAPWEVAAGKVKAGTTLTLAEFQKLPAHIQDVLKNLGANIVTPLDQADKALRQKIIGMVTVTTQEFAALPEKIQGVLERLGVKIKDPVAKGIADAQAAAKTGTNELITTLNGVGPKVNFGLDAVPKNPLAGVFDGAKAETDKAVTDIQNSWFGLGRFFAENKPKFDFRTAGPTPKDVVAQPQAAAAPVVKPGQVQQAPKIDTAPITAAQKQIANVINQINTSLAQITTSMNNATSSVVAGVNKIGTALVALVPLANSSVNYINTALIALVQGSTAAAGPVAANLNSIAVALRQLAPAAANVGNTVNRVQQAFLLLAQTTLVAKTAITGSTQQIGVSFVAMANIAVAAIRQVGQALIILVKLSDGARAAVVNNIEKIKTALLSMRGAATTGVAGVVARMNQLSNSVASTRARIATEVARINALLASIKSPSGGGGSGGLDGNPLTPFARGGVVNRATMALIGEAGKEAVIPVTDARRAAALMVQSGLADIPAVQRAVMDRLRLQVGDTVSRSVAGAMPKNPGVATNGAGWGRGPAGLPTLSERARTALSQPAAAAAPAKVVAVPAPAGSSRKFEDNREQHFHFHTGDAETLAEMIRNRNDPSWGER